MIVGTVAGGSPAQPRSRTQIARPHARRKTVRASVRTGSQLEHGGSPKFGHGRLAIHTTEVVVIHEIAR